MGKPQADTALEMTPDDLVAAVMPKILEQLATATGEQISTALAAFEEKVSSDAGPKLDDNALTTLVRLKIEELLPQLVIDTMANIATAEADTAEDERRVAADAVRESEKRERERVAKAEKKRLNEREAMRLNAQENYAGLMEPIEASNFPPVGAVQAGKILVGNGRTFCIDVQVAIETADLVGDDRSMTLHKAIELDGNLPEAFEVSELVLVLQLEEGFVALRCDLNPTITIGAGRPASFPTSSLVFRAPR